MTDKVGWLFFIVYSPSKQNTVDDALSRIPDACLMLLTVSTFEVGHELKALN